jgi:hypothetical protein
MAATLSMSSGTFRHRDERVLRASLGPADADFPRPVCAELLVAIRRILNGKGSASEELIHMRLASRGSRLPATMSHQSAFGEHEARRRQPQGVAAPVGNDSRERGQDRWLPWQRRAVWEARITGMHMPLWILTTGWLSAYSAPQQGFMSCSNHGTGSHRIRISPCKVSSVKFSGFLGSWKVGLSGGCKPADADRMGIGAGYGGNQQLTWGCLLAALCIRPACDVSLARALQRPPSAGRENVGSAAWGALPPEWRCVSRPWHKIDKRAGSRRCRRWFPPLPAAYRRNGPDCAAVDL